MKLGVAMIAMLRLAGDVAADLYLDANRKANAHVRTTEGKIGRSSKVDKSSP